MAQHIDIETLLAWLKRDGASYAQNFYWECANHLAKRSYIQSGELWGDYYQANNEFYSSIDEKFWILHTSDPNEISSVYYYTNGIDSRNTSGTESQSPGIYAARRLNSGATAFRWETYYVDGNGVTHSRSWRSTSYIQDKEKFLKLSSSQEETGYDVISFIAAPVFTNNADGVFWCSLVAQYILNPTDDMLKLLREFLRSASENSPGSGTDPDDPNADDPDYPSRPGGGGGSHNQSSDPIGVPGLPTIGAQSLGVVTMYKLTSAEMGVFGQEMTASDLWQAVKLFFQNPMDYIIGCTLLPFTPPGDSVWYPKIGGFTFNHAYPIVSSQFIEVDCGSLIIDEYWCSCFDYEPYTQITLWLPYIGYRAIPVDQIMGKTIFVKYHIDCLSGDCIAFVGVSAVGPYGPDIEKVLGQFSGNCAVQMPYGSMTFDQILSSGISMLAGAGVFAATGGNGGGDIMANSAMSMLAGVKGEVQQGGTIGSTGGYIGVQKPYIIKRIRRQSLPNNYRSLKGYPSNMYGTLSQLTGYAEVDDIQLNNIPAMESERKEIIELLKGGVLL